MGVEAYFFDGESARDWKVTVRKTDDALEFEGDHTPPTRWTISGLHPIDPPTSGQPFRLTHDSQRGSRLVLRDEAFISELIAANSSLKGGYSLKHLGQVLGWTAGGLATAAALGWIAMSFLPQQLAHLLPSDWRNRVGDQIVGSLIGTAKKCETPEGNAAISAMVSALADGNPDLPPISVSVYDVPIMNAFAAPGGKIIFTYELIQKADAPDEVAGVLAHEIGHVAHLHPEAQMVRLAGMQILISSLTGGGSGEWAGNIAAIAALFRYSRDAEREADEYARSVMSAASVDTAGLKRFFEKVMKLEAGSTNSPDSAATNKQSALDKIGDVFSTHPGTADRIKEIIPLPAGKSAVQIMTPQQWTALKAICR